ncbi:hypothetical protein DPEC_G00126290 [Dallia pectoralis]|uniref:Uncharacterized protein n=1 Tax=Dallia pectoralis TaxID=75939 RepID=A0ACC2GRC3_DALPE|nr:hypothetical protein DPEC_G00126290 [Dallia pectoralis]
MLSSLCLQARGLDHKPDCSPKQALLPQGRSTEPEVTHNRLAGPGRQRCAEEHQDTITRSGRQVVRPSYLKD